MSHITVYTKPSCPQCECTKKHLIRNNIEFRAVDITQDHAAREKVSALGYTSAPVVVSGDVHFSGFRPDRLLELGSLAPV